MSVEAIPPQPLPWTDQARLHPEVSELLKIPFDDLVHLAAETLTEGQASIEGTDDDANGEFTVTAGLVKIGENYVAEEFIKVQTTKRSVSVVYGSRYKGVIGQAIQPVGSWAISVEDDGTRYLWDERRHGETETLFALAATDCDELPSGAEDDEAIVAMKQYLALALHAHDDPGAIADPGKSVIPPFNLQAHLSYITSLALNPRVKNRLTP